MVEDIRATLAASAQRAQQMAQMMALRDGFAAQAMQALIVNPLDVPIFSPETVASQAYQFADAMLRARAAPVAAKGKPS